MRKRPADKKLSLHHWKRCTLCWMRHAREILRTLNRCSVRQAPQLIASGEAGAVKELLAGFVKAYGEKHSLSVEAQGIEFPQVGQSNWPSPIPILRDGKDWYFDVDRGNQEILDRRIGRNELGAIGVCEGYVQSQVDYAAKGHDGNATGIYAQQFLSDPGQTERPLLGR